MVWHGYLNQSRSRAQSKQNSLHRIWGFDLLRVNQIQWPSGCGCFLPSVWWIWLLVPLQVEQIHVRAQPLAGHRGQCRSNTHSLLPLLLWGWAWADTLGLPRVVTYMLPEVCSSVVHTRMRHGEIGITHRKDLMGRWEICEVQSSVTRCLHVTSHFIPPLLSMLVFPPSPTLSPICPSPCLLPNKQPTLTIFFLLVTVLLFCS